jgi:hypothetical protein
MGRRSLYARSSCRCGHRSRWSARPICCARTAGPLAHPAIGQGDASSLAGSDAVREPVPRLGRDDRAEIPGRIQWVVSIPSPSAV